MSKQNFSLIIEALVLDINIGQYADERINKQKIQFDVKIDFLDKPAPCETDGADFICYHEICKKIMDYCDARDFQLLEFLANEILKLVKSQIEAENKISVKVKKLNPPVPYQIGGAAFEISES